MKNDFVFRTYKEIYNLLHNLHWRCNPFLFYLWVRNCCRIFQWLACFLFNRSFSFLSVRLVPTLERIRCQFETLSISEHIIFACLWTFLNSISPSLRMGSLSVTNLISFDYALKRNFYNPCSFLVFVEYTIQDLRITEKNLIELFMRWRFVVDSCFNVFNWNHFEMRLLNLRINFFINCGLFCPHLGSFCVASSFTMSRPNFTSGDFTATRIGILSLVTVPPVITAFHSCCLSHHVFWPSKPLAGHLLTMLTWNCRDSTPLSAAFRAPKGDQGWIFSFYKSNYLFSLSGFHSRVRTEFVIVFNWNHFEMRLLNLRINLLFIAEKKLILMF